MKNTKIVLHGSIIHDTYKCKNKLRIKIKYRKGITYMVNVLDQLGSLGHMQPDYVPNFQHPPLQICYEIWLKMQNTRSIELLILIRHVRGPEQRSSTHELVKKIDIYTSLPVNISPLQYIIPTTSQSPTRNTKLLIQEI